MKKIKLLMNKYFLNKKYNKVNTKIYSKYVSSDIILGKNVLIGEKVFIDKNVFIGDNSYINSDYNFAYLDNNIIIGKYCSIGPEVAIGFGEHNYRFVSTHPFLYSKLSDNNKNNINENFNKKTIIGNDVWIGARAIIKKGVTIGDGAVIAMNAVVTKDVEPYSIVAGVPAKIIKYRFNNDQINYLLKNQWWNFDEEKLNHNIAKMYDINEFVSKGE